LRQQNKNDGECLSLFPFIAEQMLLGENQAEKMVETENKFLTNKSRVL